MALDIALHDRAHNGTVEDFERVEATRKTQETNLGVEIFEIVDNRRAGKCPSRLRHQICNGDSLLRFRVPYAMTLIQYDPTPLDRERSGTPWESRLRLRVPIRRDRFVCANYDVVVLD